jgi:Kef-type K+ transport system membrane component KefB/nucleotide-binding universal stress UspA family protein
MLEHLLDEPVGIFLIIVAVILLAPMLSTLLRLPSIIGLILGGVIVGPYGLGLLERDGAILLLATVGLIYLMFSAGAEIDLTQFNKVRNRSLTFGVLTFIIPQTLGTGLGLLLGYELLSAILLGSMFASHTLISFPIITRLGITRNEAVSVTVGATIITDIAALLVLAAVAGVAVGNVEPLYFVQLVVLLLVYTVVILFAVPRIGRFFFKRFRAGAVEFQFTLVVIFVAAFMAELIGMEAIVGAFLAGLAINSTVPHRSAVMGRVLFIGESFFIPIFLISIGLLINPAAFFTDARTLLVSAALVITVLVTKYLASVITAWRYGYSRDEVQVMWALSMAQAAATLAATLVGMRLGLFDEAIFNGVITMILVTCVLSPLLVERFGPKLSANNQASRTAVEALSAIKRAPIFSRILIPVANPNTEEFLIQLAGILARSGSGTLMPLNVARLNNGRVEGLEHQQHLLEAESLNDPDTTIQPIRRIDTSISDGILSAAMEYEVSSILMGWSGQSSFRETVFGRMLDQVIWSSQVPVFVGRLTSPINAKRQVLLVIPANSITLALVNEVVTTGVTIARAINVPMEVLVAPQFMDAVRAEQSSAEFGFQIKELDTHIVRHVIGQVHPQDLVLVTTSGSQQWFQSSLGSIPEELASRIPSSLIVMHFPTEITA